MPDRLAFIHGFTQTSQSWAPIASSFAATHDVRLLDAPGHGAASEQRDDLVDGAASLAAAGGQATYVGYSMGGRFALHVALHHPDVVEALVLVSATPGIADAGDRERRRAEDEQRAVAVETGGVDAFVDGWLSLPLLARVPHDEAEIAARKGNTAGGLASSLRLAGTGSQEPLWERLPELTMRVLLVAGADDPRFATIARSMHARIPGSELRIVEHAGHAVHLERPDVFTAILREFLAH